MPKCDLCGANISLRDYPHAKNPQHKRALIKYFKKMREAKTGWFSPNLRTMEDWIEPN